MGVEASGGGSRNVQKEGGKGSTISLKGCGTPMALATGSNGKEEEENLILFNKS